MGGSSGRNLHTVWFDFFGFNADHRWFALIVDLTTFIECIEFLMQLSEGFKADLKEILKELVVLSDVLALSSESVDLITNQCRAMTFALGNFFSIHILNLEKKEGFGIEKPMIVLHQVFL